VANPPTTLCSESSINAVFLFFALNILSLNCAIAQYILSLSLSLLYCKSRNFDVIHTYIVYLQVTGSNTIIHLSSFSYKKFKTRTIANESNFHCNNLGHSLNTTMIVITKIYLFGIGVRNIRG
jgi:hypothetical protein